MGESEDLAQPKVSDSVDEDPRDGSKRDDSEGEAEGEEQLTVLGLCTENQSAFLRRRKVECTLAAVFIVFHLAAMLINGAPPQIRDVLNPPVSWYSDGLRMAAKWGMFGAEHKLTAVYTVGVDTEGKRHALYPRTREDNTLFRRIVDSRIRKMQTAFMKEKKRQQRGRDYARYLCRETPHGATLRSVRMEKGASFDEVKDKREFLMQVTCPRKVGGAK